jgi:heme/copper-type cytochrome/quinol oxidase subunit 2
LLEQVWTITPAIILGVISVPSFSLLYSMDEIKNSAITLKVIGHQ